MDNSRQAKCSSPWQSLTPPAAAPSQIQPQQPRNQHLNACSYPHVMQEVNSASRGMIQEATACNTSPNLFPNHSGYADSGSLYPEILSGYPSFQKNDLQRFPIPKPFSSSSKSPVSSSSYIVRPAGFEGSHAPTERVSQNIGTQKMKVKADPRRVIPSLEVPTCSHSSGYSLLDVLQAANLNRQSSECARPVIYRQDAGRGKVKEVSGLADGWLPSTRSSGEKFHSASIQPLQKAPPLAYFSLSHPLSAHTSGCPRVFCLRTSGDLLLSNTGLLGVQCLCHGLHISISKFSEHSGSYGVNPGYAVRVDSGETIAQWRKIYFQKFGIRVPEDQDGWDWPEGFSAAAGTVKYSSMPSHLSRNSDPPTEFVQPSNNETFLKSSCKGQKCSDSVSSVGKEMNAQNGCGFSKGFVGASPSDMATVFNRHFTVGRQMNAQNGCGFRSKGLIGASQRNFPTLSSSQIMKMPVGGCPTTSKFAAGLGGPVSGCHPISDGLDSMCKSQHPCISRDLPNPNTSLKVSDLRRLYNMKEGNIGDKDASSSSFELRLGQPSSPSQTSGSVCPALRSHQLETRGDLLKSLPPRPMIHNSNSKVLEERLQHAGDCPVSNSKTNQSRWNIGNNAPVVNHGRGAAKLEPLNGDVDRSLILSMLLSQYRTPVDTIDSRTTSCLVSGHNVTTSKLLCDSRFVKHDPENSHVGIAITKESEQNISKLNPGEYSDKMKGIGRVSGGLCVATEPSKDFHPKHLDTSTNSGGLGKASRISSIEANDHSAHQQQFSGKLPDECSDINSLKHSDKVPSLVVKRSMDPLSSRGAAVTLGPGTVLPMQGVSMGCVATTISVPNTAPTLSMKDNKCKPPNPLDENSKQFRVLAFRDIIELFNQGQTNTSLGVEKDLGRLHEGSVACSSSSKEQDVTNVAAIILQPGLACYTGGTGESISPSTPDLDRRCNNSMFSPEKALCDKSLGAKFPLSHEHLPAEPPPERYVRTENDISSVNIHRKGFQNLHFQGKSDCNALSDSCSKIRNSELRAGSLGCTISKFIDPKSNEKTPMKKVQVISFHEIGNLEREVKKKVDNQAFQWKDVPSKQTRPQSLAFKDQPCNVSDRGENSVERIADAASKCSDRAAQDVVSSGCSAPAITQASVFSNNIDTTTVDTGDKFAQSRVLDEESGIDECWSSDDLTNSERSSEFCSVTCKTYPTNEGSSKLSLNCVSRSLIDELRLRDSLVFNKVRKTSHTGLSVDERRSQALTCYGDPKTGKRKRPMKCKLPNASSPGSASDESGKYIPRYCSSTKGLLHLHSAKRRSNTSSCSLGPGLKPRSVLCSTKHLSCETETDRLYGERDWGNDMVQSDADSDVSDTPNDSCRKKLKLDKIAPAMKPILKLASICADNVVNAKVDSPDHMITSSDHVATCGKVGPVVCGEYGVISNGNSFKPVKIFPLIKVIKAARRCTAADNDQGKSFSLEKVIKRSSMDRSGRIDKFSNPKRKNGEAKEFNSDGSLKETQNACFPARRKPDISPHTYEKETNDGKEKDHEAPASCVGTQLKPKCKEVRKRGLYELVVEGKGSSYGDVSAAKASIDLPQRKCKYLSEIYKADDDTLKKSCTASAKSTKAHNGQCSTVNGGPLCCVCGSSDDDQMNCLLECGQCLVRVHQACYGVPILPKGQWYCRPCLTNSRDIVCVLCGYGGGAMTRALRSQNIVKGLLKAWNVIIESDPRDKVCLSQEFKGRIGMSNSSSAIVTEMEILKQSDCMKSGSSSCKLEIHNSITAGVHDANVKQWIHIVCGLWTPGTRCPDVNTMSAFDVYGASSPNPHGVCSICNRSGGTCIQCRVEGCSEQFHPWCGHQKGLLQSEVEGLNNESIGFYGRCQLHATYHQGDPNTDPVAVETGICGEKECTSARTEGYKGRKPDGLLRNDPCQFNSSGRCAVSQEHLNAWLHINRLISSRKGCPELPDTDVEHDHRKEYARYKQSKGWKKLVVYKSGIHALGLYTSQFIDCGALVVEYIGEVVGLRVADKRENEYESGRKFQSKSACYFFRIDKEHIIDATCKGGIARFVNHSCQPNCIAKVISVKNEKKVVFFAERDIYPGEEITYDYHFNNEDERKKIPCLCKSNNCRRYLN